MRFDTDALIIYENTLGENDRIVTALTRKRGVIRAFVRGAQNIKNPKCGATRLLCYSDISVYEGREKYIIDSAESKEMFIALRNDVGAMSLAQYFCQLCFELCPSEVPADEFLQAVLNSLYMLCKGNKPHALVKAVFELRLLSLAGYMPDLLCCTSCGKFEAEEMYFSVNDGVLFCGDCKNKISGKAVMTGLSVTAAMRHAIYAEPKQMFSFNIAEPSLLLFAQTAEDYVLSRLNKKLPALDFYKVISN